MLYFALLPAGLCCVVLLDALVQRAFAHFIDLSRLLRVALVACIAWASGGWFMEAEFGERVAAVAEQCQSDLTPRLSHYGQIVDRMIGLGP